MVRMDTGQTIKFTYSERHMDMTKDMYLSTIFSPDAVSLGNLSSKDLKGVKQGKALKGMSKQGVMTALGYPAAHRTPSLDENEWIYWANRFKTKAVIFNESGKVSGFR